MSRHSASVAAGSEGFNNGPAAFSPGRKTTANQTSEGSKLRLYSHTPSSVGEEEEGGGLMKSCNAYNNKKKKKKTFSVLQQQQQHETTATLGNRCGRKLRQIGGTRARCTCRPPRSQERVSWRNIKGANHATAGER